MPKGLVARLSHHYLSEIEHVDGNGAKIIASSKLGLSFWNRKSGCVMWSFPSQRMSTTKENVTKWSHYHASMIISEA